MQSPYYIGERALTWVQDAPQECIILVPEYNQDYKLWEFDVELVGPLLPYCPRRVVRDETELEKLPQ